MAKRGRCAFDREAELEKIKKVLRADPTLTTKQLRERFQGRKQLVAEARKQLLEEGVIFPIVGERGITCHKRRKDISRARSNVQNVRCVQDVQGQDGNQS